MMSESYSSCDMQGWPSLVCRVWELVCYWEQLWGSSYQSACYDALNISRNSRLLSSRGVETVAFANSSSTFPSTTIALSLTGGFTCMLLLERIIHKVAPGSHTHSPLPTSDPNGSTQQSRVEFDVELGDLEREEGMPPSGSMSAATGLHLGDDVVDKARAYPLTLGLIVHALADGFALGSSATSPIDRGLSVTVFLALIIHKGEFVCRLLHPT